MDIIYQNKKLIVYNAILQYASHALEIMIIVLNIILISKDKKPIL